MSRLLDNLLYFGRLLRRAGIDVHPGRMIDVVEALGHVNLATRDEVYHTCRALLVHRREQLAVFDAVFDNFWRQRLGRRSASGSLATPPSSTVDKREPPSSREIVAHVGPVADSDEEAPSFENAVNTWSDRSGLAAKDFAALTPGEIAEARLALARLIWNPGERRTRRWVRGRGPKIDLRRAISDSLRTGGDIVRLKRRMRAIRPRPLVLLCDVSGSMEGYSRMLLHFAHAVTKRHRRVEAFLFSTELTRITRELRLARPDDALGAVSRSVRHWSGGTRIGEAVKEFHQRWSRRALVGGPVVLIISDGWDCGDPGDLRDQIARLQRSCHRLIWLNPLIGTVDYAPLTRGLQAALPYVDDFLPARTLNNLADLAIHLNALA
jgi:uncharacterized protein with von Willebrand factor type A (vWA) domain